MIGAGETEDEDLVHVARIQVDRRRGEHPGECAEQRGQPPSEGEHPADADAEDARDLRVERGGAHAQPECGALKDEEEQQHRDQDGADREEIERRDVERRRPGDEVDVRDRHRERLRLAAEEHRRHRLEEDEHAEAEDHRVERRSRLHRTHEDALGDRAETSPVASATTKPSQYGAPCRITTSAM